MPTEKNAAFLPTQYSFKLDRQRVKPEGTPLSEPPTQPKQKAVSGKKCQGYEADLSPPPGAKVTYEWSYTFPCHMPSWNANRQL